jgi:hypothetical protein
MILPAIRHIMIFLQNSLFALILSISVAFSKDFLNDNKNIISSILSINIIYDDNFLNTNSSHQCDLFFYDDFNKIVKKTIDKNSNYIILESMAGKIFLKEITCYRKNLSFLFGGYRTKYIDDRGFVAHDGYINYAGDITISFNSSYLLMSDFYNLSAFATDYNGIINFKTDDKIFEAINFVKYNFGNNPNLKIAKSLFNDNHSLKPNDDPEVFNINQRFEPIDKISENQIINNPPQNFQNPYQNIYKYVEQTDQENQRTPQLLKAKNDMPSHPYLAPYYSEFYSPNYNQYYSINGNIYDNKNVYLDVQDPVQEKPWFEPQPKENN